MFKGKANAAQQVVQADCCAFGVKWQLIESQPTLSGKL
jgi:hypothetical protein